MIPEHNNFNRLPRYWLLIGVTALAVAGLFALVLVAARTPGLADIPLLDSLFHKALVVHVDLSVLVWFLAMACLLWSLLVCNIPQKIPGMEEAALVSFALGMLAIALSSLDQRGFPLMSNYIPVITSPVFFIGLALLACGVALMLLKLLLSFPHLKHDGMDFGIASAGVITFFALVAFVCSYKQMPSEIIGQQYYELVFWGGGHLLQFVHVQMAMVCWLFLARALRPDIYPHGKVLQLLFCVGLTTALLSPLAYILYNVASMKHRDFFTDAMILANGFAPVVLAIFMLPILWQSPRNALWSSMLMSIFLFIYGGILGGMIQGQNIVIPAHYHGSIVGVTLAFMGAAYMLLKRFGYRDVSEWKLAFWQPIVYGGGQFMHITGMAWSGGYGVLRKTPGAINEVSASVKAGMGLMGLGGLFAIIGGFMFVIVAARAIFGKKSAYRQG